MWKDAESGHGGRKNALEVLQELGEEKSLVESIIVQILVGDAAGESV